MAKVTIMGRDFEIAPYKLGQLRQAAPIIERLNAAFTRAGAANVALDDMVSSLGDLVAFVAVGIRRVDPSVTIEAIEDSVGFDDLPALQAAFLDILRESGFTKGEAKAASGDGAPETASSSSSAAS